MIERRFRVPLVPVKLRLTLVFSVMATILYYSIVTPPGTDRVVYGPFELLFISVWLHMLAYAGLTVTVVYAFVKSGRPNWQIFLGVFLFVTIFGFGIEFLQLSLPNRAFDVSDILVNAFGSVVALVVWTIALRYIEFYHVGPPNAFRIRVR